MEVEEGDAKMCRLCGQYERIYIDVFGEEGIKRYLGLKIHRKINIVIDEKDPLPKAICVQCLGKLEFVCDFQEECLRTQETLRDHYNLPPLTESIEVKNEESASPVGTSSADNNNSIEKNLNSTRDSQAEESQGDVVKNSEPKKKKHTPKILRSLRSQQQQQASKCNDETAEKNQGTETSPTRWLRSKQSADSSNAVDDVEEIPIANRLRSQNNVENNAGVRSANNNSNSSTESVDKQGSPKQQQDSTITTRLPTSALNKLLTIFSSSPDIEVSVKETRNRTDTEDISFTVELCKKQNDEVLTARARVFPDQGYCLVDTRIVDLLQSEGNAEVNGIVSSILSSTSTKNSSAMAKLKNLAELEQRLEATQNPADLFKIDGEEIKVDDNVEHVVNGTQNGYACKLCRKFYERRDKCTVHVKTHLGIKQYTCVVCNAKFVCKSDVMKHIRCSHTNPRPIQCPKCPKRFKSKFYLAEHDNVHKGVRPYSCADCGQSYHHKVSLQIHMKSHLPPQNLACEFCGKVFPFRTRLLGHIASVHTKKRRNFRCRFCYNLYSSLAVLNEHIKTRHATTYTCDTCGKTFKVSSKYKAHVLQHSNPKPFECNVCNNRYASKAFLNEHLLKHEGLRKHICQECGARFAQASHLAAHRHVHGEKTHACPECGKKFNRRDNMKVHRKRHFGEKKTGAAGKQKVASNNNLAAFTASVNEK
ncbi:PREDICTED: zinc finger protein 182-like [Vollenhovia emeryi]|uniref:zinc finger protein 182-like n=1 Tax=Vollenhovia emeryi TaxID=411798 RepID=UPI0005F3E3C4|nr:PREDICTED: zinc finger protein 182-like [Vollenhovia emeryi]